MSAIFIQMISIRQAQYSSIPVFQYSKEFDYGVANYDRPLEDQVLNIGMNY